MAESSGANAANLTGIESGMEENTVNQDLVNMFLAYTAAVSALAICCCSCCLRMKQRCAFARRSYWPWQLRGTVGLLVFLLVLVPLTLIVVCLVFGALLALAEGWKAQDGFEYVMSNALGFQDPLTTIAPTNNGGRMLDLVVSTYAMLIVTSAMGLSAGMAPFSALANAMPQTILGFFRYLILWIPISMFLMSAITGALMASLEGWPFKDGFYFMAGALAGLADPLIDEGPKTAVGLFFEGLFMGMELSVAGAIIGIISMHPITEKIVGFLEGSNTSSDELAKMMCTATTESVTQDPHGEVKTVNVEELLGIPATVNETSQLDGAFGIPRQASPQEQYAELKQERERFVASLKQEVQQLARARAAVMAQRAVIKQELDRGLEAALEEVREELRHEIYAAEEDRGLAAHALKSARAAHDQQQIAAEEDREHATRARQTISELLSAGAGAGGAPRPEMGGDAEVAKEVPAPGAEAPAAAASLLRVPRMLKPKLRH